MELIRISRGELAFGEDSILDKADLQINTGERVCLVGRNGAGKSSLLKVLMGLQHLDDGQMLMSNDIRIAMLEQDPPESCDMQVFDYVAQGVAQNAKLLTDYHSVTNDIAKDPSEANLTKLANMLGRMNNV